MRVKKSFIILSVSLLLISITSCQKIKDFIGIKPEKDMALVLSGGGAKGAYEIGVWKALEEKGLCSRINTVSGTSVGALNAALFASVSRTEAEKLWKKEVGFYSFLMPDSASFENIVLYVNRLINMYGEFSASDEDIKSSDSDEVLDIVAGAASSLFTAALDLTEYILGAGHSGGLFKRDALEKILKDYITLEKIRDSGVNVYVSALEKDFLDLSKILSLLEQKSSVKFFSLAEQKSSENIHKLLLASSALPVAYPSQKLPADIVFNGRELGKSSEYIDGGFNLFGGANTPTEPAEYDPASKTVIVVYLQSLNELGGKESLIEIPGKEKVINIIPSRDLGTIISGTVNFMSGKTETLIDLGYQDAMKALSEAGL